jgi:hypothetical protein
MGGPKVPWRPGRIDGFAKDVTPDGHLPDAAQGQDHLRAVSDVILFSMTSHNDTPCPFSPHTSECPKLAPAPPRPPSSSPLTFLPPSIRAQRKQQRFTVASLSSHAPFPMHAQPVPRVIRTACIPSSTCSCFNALFPPSFPSPVYLRHQSTHLFLLLN